MYGVELGMDQFWRKATADVEALQRSIDTLLKRIVSNTTSECATEVTAVEAYTNKNETTYNWIPEGGFCWSVCSVMCFTGGISLQLLQGSWD
jgi:hypothetical protein